jgi:hypothetical protein
VHTLVLLVFSKVIFIVKIFHFSYVKKNIFLIRTLKNETKKQILLYIYDIIENKKKILLYIYDIIENRTLLLLGY